MSVSLLRYNVEQLKSQTVYHIFSEKTYKKCDKSEHLFLTTFVKCFTNIQGDDLNGK